MTDQALVLDLVGDIYDCAVQPAQWPATLQRVAETVGGSCATLSLQDPLNRTARFSFSWGTSPEVERLYAERFAAISPVLTSGWFCEIDEVVSAMRYAGETDYLNSRFYREFIQPLGWYDGLGVHLAKSANRYSLLAIMGSSQKGLFSDRDIACAHCLSPHIRRAVLIADLLDAKALRDDALSVTLDLLTVGIVLVDAQGRIVHANAAGARALDDRTALRRDGDRLSARDAYVAAQLKSAVAVAAAGHTIDMPSSGISLPIPSSDGHDLAAWVLPLDGGLRRDLAASFAAKAVVFVRELGSDTSPFPGELFVKHYGITPAECRVLMLLVQGMNPTEASDALGCSLPTVKTHMARLFEKTGTRGQPDLMRLAMSALAPAAMSDN